MPLLTCDYRCDPQFNSVISKGRRSLSKPNISKLDTCIRACRDWFRRVGSIIFNLDEKTMTDEEIVDYISNRIEHFNFRGDCRVGSLDSNHSWVPFVNAIQNSLRSLRSRPDNWTIEKNYIYLDNDKLDTIKSPSDRKKNKIDASAFDSLRPITIALLRIARLQTQLTNKCQDATYKDKCKKEWSNNDNLKTLYDKQSRLCVYDPRLDCTTFATAIKQGRRNLHAITWNDPSHADICYPKEINNGRCASKYRACIAECRALRRDTYNNLSDLRCIGHISQPSNSSKGSSITLTSNEWFKRELNRCKNDLKRINSNYYITFYEQCRLLCARNEYLCDKIRKNVLLTRWNGKKLDPVPERTAVFKKDDKDRNVSTVLTKDVLNSGRKALHSTFDKRWTPFRQNTSTNIRDIMRVLQLTLWHYTGDKSLLCDKEQPSALDNMFGLLKRKLSIG